MNVDADRTAALTPRQKFVLDWLASNHQSRSRWMRSGKDAYGPPEKWDAIEISGRDGSVVIAEADWRALSSLIEVAPFDSGRMYQPRSAVTQHQPNSVADTTRD